MNRFDIFECFFVSQKNKTAGFLDYERIAFEELTSSGFTDVYRHFCPHTQKYFTFWSFFGGAKAKDMGWRLDYFLVSQRVIGAAKTIVRRKEVSASEFVMKNFVLFQFYSCYFTVMSL